MHKLKVETGAPLLHIITVAISPQSLTIHHSRPCLKKTTTLKANYHDLFWAVGDSGPQEDPNDHGQSTDTLFGTVVRISVPSQGTGYEVPSGNYPGSGE